MGNYFAIYLFLLVNNLSLSDNLALLAGRVNQSMYRIFFFFPFNSSFSTDAFMTYSHTRTRLYTYTHGVYTYALINKKANRFTGITSLQCSQVNSRLSFTHSLMLSKH